MTTKTALQDAKELDLALRIFGTTVMQSQLVKDFCGHSVGSLHQDLENLIGALKGLSETGHIDLAPLTIKAA